MACIARRLIPGIWVTHAGNIALAPLDAGFMLAEVEGPADRQGLVDSLASLRKIPRAILTNFWGFQGADGQDDPALAAPLIEAGFGCLTECYMGSNPNATPERMDYRARRLGWSRSQPCFGIWNKPLSEYEQWQEWPGWSVYLAEYL